jgi:hypothetical protein
MPTINYGMQGGGAARVPAHHLRAAGGVSTPPPNSGLQGGRLTPLRPAGQPLALGGRVGQEQE